MAPKILVADPAKCTGCRLCQIACSLKQAGVSSPIKSRIKIYSADTGLFLPVSCQHCEDAPCMKVCPKEAIFHDEGLERVMVDYHRCVSCQACSAACPYGAILFDTAHRKVYKCDLCGGSPECIHFCEPGALRFTDRNMIQYSQLRRAALKLTGKIKNRPRD